MIDTGREDGFYWLDVQFLNGMDRIICRYFKGDWYLGAAMIGDDRVSNVNESRIIETA